MECQSLEYYSSVIYILLLIIWATEFKREHFTEKWKRIKGLGKYQSQEARIILSKCSLQNRVYLSLSLSVAHIESLHVQVL